MIKFCKVFKNILLCIDKIFRNISVKKNNKPERERERGLVVASGERSFSNVKLTKAYLRLAISQRRVNNLAMLIIKNCLQTLTSKIF